MGYIAHDAVIVTTEDFRPGGLPDIDAFRAEMPEPFRDLVIGPVETAVNGTLCYVFLPDGSKEGWETSDEADYWRDRFRALFTFAYEDGSSPDDMVSIRFGGDHAREMPPKITHVYPEVEADACCEECQFATGFKAGKNATLNDLANRFDEQAELSLEDGPLLRITAVWLRGQMDE